MRSIMRSVSRSSPRILMQFVAAALLAQQVVTGAKLSERHSMSQNSLSNVRKGTIKSPNFPSPYPADTDATWTITGNADDRIRLEFKAFMLENSSDCETDYVRILGGIQGDHKTDHKFCGKLETFTIDSNSNVLVVIFHSDKTSGGYPGFEASFQLVGVSTNDTKSDRADNCQCGVTNDRRRRVVGGQQSPAHKYPWLAVLVRKETPDRAHCGAVLICGKYLLTAAHCTYMKTAEYYSAVLGAYNLTNKEPTQVTVGVKRLIPHADYFKPTENNDIALVELDREVEYNSAVKPICMPPLGKDFAGENAVVAGWGRTSYGGELSSIPREVVMPVVTQKECQRSFSKANANITDNMMCAGVLDGSIDACQGDSGGPLMWKDPSDDKTKTIGITSFGVRCATKDYYGAYTRVNRYKDWILSNTGGACPCLFK